MTAFEKLIASCQRSERRKRRLEMLAFLSDIATIATAGGVLYLILN